MTLYTNTPLLIDGRWRDASEGAKIPVINPATEEVIGYVAHATHADLDEALAAAERGFALWRNVSAFERSKVMRKSAELLRERAETIARLMTLEQGKPIAQSRMEVLAAADIIDWFAEEARRSYGQVIPARSPDVLQITLKDPVGPVAAFTPWNFPINQIVRKLAAALATGCSIIVKAPEETPASPAHLLRCFTDAGIPAGVIGLVFGIPSEISEYLIPHPVIRKITFTGSTPIGKQLAGLAGLHMKRVTMELGGHAPVIVSADADIDHAAALMTGHKFRNAGQVCVAPTRYLLEDGIAEQFTQKMLAETEKLRVGNGLDLDTDMGPLANDRRIPAIERLVADALDCGARLLTGGHRIGNKGYYYAPTILADVPLDAAIMNEEPFGPVAILNRVCSVDEAITEANRLPFGLAAYAFTGASDTAHKLRAKVRAGMLSVNHLGLGLPELPFGGLQDSGYGTEGGSEAIAAYLDTRLVTQLL